MQTKKILLLHGWGGSDYPHWQSWLAAELAKEYGCVCFLRLSDAENPKLETWIDELTCTLEDFQPDIVICHSLANSLWFHLCNREKISHKIQKLYLVAPPSLECKVKELQEFFPLHLPTHLYAQEVEMIISDNDPYMPLKEGEKLAKQLRVTPIILKNAGHINTQSGFGPWPFMLQKVKT